MTIATTLQPSQELLSSIANGATAIAMVIEMQISPSMAVAMVLMSSQCPFHTTSKQPENGNATAATSGAPEESAEG